MIFNSIKFQISSVVGILLLVILLSFPLITNQVESKLTSAHETQTILEQTKVIKSLVKNHQDELVARMRFWFTSSNLSLISDEKITDIEAWESSLLGIGNSVASKYGVESILSYNVDGKLLFDYKTETAAPQINYKNATILKLLNSSIEDDSIERSYFYNSKNEIRSLIIIPIENEVTEVQSFHVLVVNINYLLREYSNVTKYDSFFVFNKRNFTISESNINSYAHTGDNHFLKDNKIFYKRSIDIPSNLFGNDLTIKVFVDITQVSKSLDDIEAFITKAIIAAIALALPVLFLLIFKLLKPLSAIMKVSKDVSSGAYSKRINLNTSNEIGMLSKSFDKMLDQIESKDTSMTALLNGLTSAVFHFNEQGVISKQKSSATYQIFKDIEQMPNIEDFFTTYSKIEGKFIKELLTTLWDKDKRLPFDSIIALLSKRFVLIDSETNEEKYIDLNFKELLNEFGALENIIVIADDVTSEIIANKNSLLLEERARRISTIANYLDNYNDFKKEISLYFKAASNEIEKGLKADIKTLKEALHSLKGGCAIYDFDQVSNKIHSLEDLLSYNDIKEVLPEVKELYLEAHTIFKNEIKYLEIIFPEVNDQTKVTFSKDKFKRLTNLLSKYSDDKLNHLIQSLYQRPLAALLHGHEKYIQKLCKEEFGDKQVMISYDQDNSEVTQDEIQDLDIVFNHILRNCFDHGIESCDQREESNKDPVGVIDISLKRSVDSKLCLTIKDDGAGIDFEKLAMKAIDHEIWTLGHFNTATESDKINLIFQDSFSSKEEITTISGRGVGMGSVKSYIESIGGTINVSSQLGLGTQFNIEIPNKSIN